MEQLFLLQLFAEGEAPAAGTEAVSQPATGTAAAEGEPTGTPGSGNQPATGEAEPTFEELINGKYKREYTASVKNAVSERLKNQKQMEARMGIVQPVIDLFGSRYGVDTANLSDQELETLIGKVLEDNSLYEDEALKRGMDVETYKALSRTERENARLREYKRQTEANEANRNKFMRLQSDAQALKQVYPDFDLDAEMENPMFERLVWGSGVPMQTAYEVVHRDQILAQGMQYATQQTREQISNNIQAGMNRPQEGGLSRQSSSLSQPGGPKTWTKEEREAIKNRVKSGERVVL